MTERKPVSIKNVLARMKRSEKLYNRLAFERKKVVTVTNLLNLMGYDSSKYYKEFKIDDNFQQIYTASLAKCKKQNDCDTMKEIIINYTDVVNFITSTMGMIILGSEMAICTSKVYDGFAHRNDFYLKEDKYFLRGRIDYLAYNTRTNEICVIDMKSVGMRPTDTFGLGYRVTKRKNAQQIKFYSHMLKEILQLDYYPPAYIVGLEYKKECKVVAWKLGDLEMKPIYRPGSPEEATFVKVKKTQLAILEKRKKEKKAADADNTIIGLDKAMKNMNV